MQGHPFSRANARDWQTAPRAGCIPRRPWPIPCEYRSPLVVERGNFVSERKIIRTDRRLDCFLETRGQKRITGRKEILEGSLGDTLLPPRDEAEGPLCPLHKLRDGRDTACPLGHVLFQKLFSLRVLRFQHRCLAAPDEGAGSMALATRVGEIRETRFLPRAPDLMLKRAGVLGLGDHIQSRTGGTLGHPTTAPECGQYTESELLLRGTLRTPHVSFGQFRS
jgi:hypothetical protein